MPFSLKCNNITFFLHILNKSAVNTDFYPCVDIFKKLNKSIQKVKNITLSC